MIAVKKEGIRKIRELFDQTDCPFMSLADWSDEQVILFMLRVSLLDYPGTMDVEQYLQEVAKALKLTQLDFN